MGHILVVEDDRDSAEVLAAYLTKAGYEVECARNGREAMIALLARTPDLLVLDLILPNMDGPTLLEVVRSYLRLHALPVVVYTGVPDNSLADRVRQLNVGAILAKGKHTLADVVTCIRRELSPLNPPAFGSSDFPGAQGE